VRACLRAALSPERSFRGPLSTSVHSVRLPPSLFLSFTDSALCEREKSLFCRACRVASVWCSSSPVAFQACDAVLTETVCSTRERERSIRSGLCSSPSHVFIGLSRSISVCDLVVLCQSRTTTTTTNREQERERSICAPHSARTFTRFSIGLSALTLVVLSTASVKTALHKIVSLTHQTVILSHAQDKLRFASRSFNAS